MGNNLRSVGQPWIISRCGLTNLFDRVSSDGREPLTHQVVRAKTLCLAGDGKLPNGSLGVVDMMLRVMRADQETASVPAPAGENPLGQVPGKWPPNDIVTGL